MKRIIPSHASELVGDEPDDQYISDKIGAINRHRITRFLLIFALIHLAHIVIFWPNVPGAAGETYIWRNGVMITHAVMLVAVAVVLPIMMVLESKKPASRTGPVAMAGLVGLLYLLCGAALAIVDQRVTSSINPLVIATTGVAMVIVVRPAIAAFNYALVLVFFILGVAWTQPNANLLLTVRVNSITATGLGFGIALLQWRNQVLTIRQQRRIEEQQRELAEKNRELTLLASRDVMTGLLNRAQFILDANREVARMQRSGKAPCLVMFDIDHFKLVNDTYGHPAGDSILVDIARILTHTSRSTDLLARFGGEEFAILLPETSVQEGVHVAEKLRVAIAEQPFLVGRQSIRVTASFGVSELSIQSRDALDEGYRAADKALYQAKADGRNCVRSALRDGVPLPENQDALPQHIVLQYSTRNRP